MQQEIDFYEKAFNDHPDFAELMPVYLGTLSLNDATDVKSIDEQLPVVADHLSQQTKEEAVLMAKAAASAPAQADNIRWNPNKSRKIATNKSVVLENAAHGFKKPNILDAKLGRRLWADDAPLEKRQRFDEITRTTTNGSHGFRISGMRVYKGSDNPEELDEEGYKHFGKDYGRLHVNKDNVVQEMRRFIFNERAGIDEELGKAIAQAFLEDLRRVEHVLSNSETRMYSASLLFTFEGDGEALRAAIEQAASASAEAEKGKEKEVDDVGPALATPVAGNVTAAVPGAGGIALVPAQGSGIAPQLISGPIEGDLKVIELAGNVPMDEEDDDEPNLPRIYSLKLIDFAHAEWVPGQGPDENSLFGVRSLIKIFEELAR